MYMTLLASLRVRYALALQYPSHVQNIATFTLQDTLNLGRSIAIRKVISTSIHIFFFVQWLFDRLCGLMVRVLGYRAGGPGSIPGTTRKKSSGSGTGSTQPREYN
jgi:hypothetical protein